MYNGFGGFIVTLLYVALLIRLVQRIGHSLTIADWVVLALMLVAGFFTLYGWLLDGMPGAPWVG